MKIKLLFIFGLLSLAFACGSDQLPRGYDTITVMEYHNKYDGLGRLDRVKIIHKDYFFDNYRTREVKSNVVRQNYIYKSGGKYSIEEESSLNRKMRLVSNYTEKSEEIIEIHTDLRIINTYLWERYKGDMPSRIRRYHRFKSDIDDFEISEEYERLFRYNKNDTLTSIAHLDYLTGKISEEWHFYDISFEEAAKSVPSSNNQITIVCHMSQSVGDTLLTRRYENEVLANIYMTYRKGDSKWDLTFTPDSELSLSVETIEKGDEKIIVTKNVEFEAIDSLFCVNGKKVKSVIIFPDSKTTTITEYDRRGNVSKETEYKIWN